MYHFFFIIVTEIKLLVDNKQKIKINNYTFFFIKVFREFGIYKKIDKIQLVLTAF